ncbi:MAG: hypothetical protein K2M07_01215 [Muribaculaceae bacterium]|nr:hypothetical protein [Muribaculaceae bacterium]
MICRNCAKETGGKGRVCPHCGIVLRPRKKSQNSVSTVVVYNPFGKVIATVAVLLCVALFLFLTFRFVNKRVRAVNDLDLFEELVDKGSSADYQYLIAARGVLKSMEDYGGDVNRYEQLAEQYYNKRDDALEGWMHAAETQYEIAGSVDDALRYYHRADSICPGNTELKNQLHAMSLKSGLKGAETLVSVVSCQNNQASIKYKYYGPYDSSLRLRLVWEGGESTRITLPLKTGSDDYQVYNFELSGTPDHGCPVEIYEGQTLLFKLPTVNE